MTSDSGPKNPPQALRLGLYGGSFDPIHTGHLAVAQRARAAFDLSQVWFLPASVPPHKLDKRLAGGRDRVCMLELALADLEWARVEPMELGREGPSYTYDTAEQVWNGLPEGSQVYLLLGGDNLPGLPGWYRAQELLELVQPIVLGRSGDGPDPVGALDGRLPTELLEKLRAGFLDLPPAPGCASDIRAAMASGARDVDLHLPPGVEPYIRRRALYGAGLRTPGVDR
ncbi:MAG: nicotinate (nicotinamide) nucleotide adenylyltransferase [Planctomycetota bacterium]|nr:nicotinate (nicotinamide) nucleotide adenylyltransferase [Planctomycetota bacterium]